METFIYIVLAVSAISLAISVYLAVKMKMVVYLLEQPVVKKMSPQLKLKPVKLDEIMSDRNRNSSSSQPNREARPHQHSSLPGNNPRQGGRPDGERRDGNRDRQGGQNGRPERTEGERREGRDGDRNRGNNSRFQDRDRNRGDRPQGGQGGRPERNEGDRRPSREFNDNRDPNREQNTPVSQPAQSVMRNEAPVQQQEVPLSPRRPLSATLETQENHDTISTPSFEAGSEAFVGSDNDMQHGRRTQFKKKPRFEMDEPEVKTEG